MWLHPFKLLFLAKSSDIALIDHWQHETVYDFIVCLPKNDLKNVICSHENNEGAVVKSTVKI